MDTVAFQVEGIGGSHPVVGVPSMDVLGCELTQDGGSKQMVAARLRKNTAAFGMHKGVLLDKTVAVRTRISEYQKRVLSRALFPSSTWV